MGFSYRGNSKKKGSSAWFNWSASGKRGLHGSASVKLSKDTTINVSKHGTRVTYNFGNGFRWTGYRKREPQKVNPRIEQQRVRKLQIQTVDANAGIFRKMFAMIQGWIFGMIMSVVNGVAAVLAVIFHIVMLFVTAAVITEIVNYLVELSK